MLSLLLALTSIGKVNLSPQISVRNGELRFTAVHSRSTELVVTLSEVFGKLTPMVTKPSSLKPQRLAEIQECTARLAISASLNHVAGQSVDELSSRLSTCLGTEARKRSWNNAELERATAALALDWCRLRIKYNFALSKKDSSGEYALGRKVVSRFWSSKGVLSLQDPSAICSGMSRVALELLQKLKCKAHLVNVGVRPIFGPWPFKPESNHSIILVEFSDGTIGFADLVKAGMGIESARSQTGELRNSFSLPIHDEEKSLFWYMNYPMDYDGRLQIPEKLMTTNMSIQAWANLASSPGISVMKEFVRVSDTARTYRDSFDR